MMSRDFCLNSNQIALIRTLLDTPRIPLKDSWVSPGCTSGKFKKADLYNKQHSTTSFTDYC